MGEHEFFETLEHSSKVTRLQGFDGYIVTELQNPPHILPYLSRWGYLGTSNENPGPYQLVRIFTHIWKPSSALLIARNQLLFFLYSSVICKKGTFFIHHMYKL